MVLMLATHVVILWTVQAEIGTSSCINVSIQAVYIISGRSCLVHERMCVDTFCMMQSGMRVARWLWLQAGRSGWFDCIREGTAVASYLEPCIVNLVS